MTDKKRRQRGSRTHGGGTHKNRRGAGNRGGRGNAGRRKHQIHGQEPLGKHGFKRPESVKADVVTIDVRTLDEDASNFVADGLAAEADDGYRIDARDVADDGHDVDVVKVLGSGQVRNRLDVTADAFTDGARAKIEAAGGTVILSERAHVAEESDEGADDIDTSIEGDANED